MPHIEELPIAQLPDSFLDSIAQELWQYSVGFVRIENTPDGQDAVLLGSGTLVKVGRVRAILTAHHVLDVLPKRGRLGLILSPTISRYTIDTQALVYREIARGTVDSEGPDLGAVVLAPSIASAIAAKKIFYDLDAIRDKMLSAPPSLNDGLWLVHGFIGERTVEELSPDGRSLIKGFYNLTGAGGPDKPAVVVGSHDYYAFPVSHGARSTSPTSFGGMSGGGLWQAIVIRDQQRELRTKELLLSGVVFYQEPTTDTQCGVKCHGPSSVYGVAYEAIGRGMGREAGP